jgi:hypothetical protein
VGHGHKDRDSLAIAASYDVITHINFVIVQAMQDDVTNRLNGLVRFEGIGYLLCAMSTSMLSRSTV